MDWQAVILTTKLAGLTTLLLLVLGTPLAWWLARTRTRLSILVQALVAMPLVLPPTVLGFYLLLLLGAGGPLAALGLEPLAFRFPGLVVGSLVYSLPFVVQPLSAAFRAIPEELLDAAASLRAGPLDRFFSLALPLAKDGVLTAAVLGFAHTVGEFGVVLMIGGNIPGATRVLSIALYDHVEVQEYAEAQRLAAGLLVFALAILVLLYARTRRWPETGR